MTKDEAVQRSCDAVKKAEQTLDAGRVVTASGMPTDIAAHWLDISRAWLSLAAVI